LNPTLVEITRGDTVESTHRGAVVAIDSSGATVLSYGDIDTLVFPRSAIKPIQAIPLVESGAAASFELTDEEIALACASHSGEPQHIKVLNQWMGRLGFDASLLECGADLPLGKKAAEQYLRDGGESNSQMHNCSGKHSGMLTLSSHLNVAQEGYSDYHHPSQQQWMAVLSQLSKVDISSMPWDRDGCGLPAISLPLKSLASAFSAFCSAHTKSDPRHLAMRKIMQVMNAHPELVAGSDRCCSAVMKVKPNLMVKVGAEGVFIAVDADAGVSVALKADDGSNRAAEVMLGAALRELGVVSHAQYEQLQDWFAPPIINSQDFRVGQIQPSAAWLR